MDLINTTDGILGDNNSSVYCNQILGTNNAIANGMRGIDGSGAPSKGGDSVFSDVTSEGGGYGGNWNSGSTNAGGNGGSGGGGSQNPTSGGGAGGVGTSGQGNNGGGGNGGGAGVPWTFTETKIAYQCSILSPIVPGIPPKLAIV